MKKVKYGIIGFCGIAEALLTREDIEAVFIATSLV